MIAYPDCCIAIIHRLGVRSFSNTSLIEGGELVYRTIVLIACILCAIVPYTNTFEDTAG